MLTLQFFRGTNKEVLIDNESRTYKPTYLGYPVFSFMEVDIDIVKPNVQHLYWGLQDIQNSNPIDAIMMQKKLCDIFSTLPDEKPVDLAAFETILSEHDFEIPSHTIKKIDDDGKTVTCDLYYCNNIPGLLRPVIEQICIAELFQIVKSGYSIKKCENCGKMFLPNKSDEKYCIRKSKIYPNMNCKQEAKYKKQLQRQQKSESSRIYHSISTMLSKRVKDAPLSSKDNAEKELYDFRNGADDWKKKIKANPNLEVDYIKWLNSFKKRK